MPHVLLKQRASTEQSRERKREQRKEAELPLRTVINTVVVQRLTYPAMSESNPAAENCRHRICSSSLRNPKAATTQRSGNARVASLLGITRHNN